MTIYPDCDLNKWSVCNSCPEYVTPSEMSAYTYSKEEIDEKIEEIVISGGGISSGEVQTMIDTSLEDYYDKEEIDEKIACISYPKISVSGTTLIIETCDKE